MRSGRVAARGRQTTACLSRSVRYEGRGPLRVPPRAPAHSVSLRSVTVGPLAREPSQLRYRMGGEPGLQRINRSCASNKRHTTDTRVGAAAPQAPPRMRSCDDPYFDNTDPAARPCGAEDEIAVRRKESVPGEGRRSFVTSGQKIRQLRRQRNRATEPWGSDHSRASRAKVGRCLHAIGSLRVRGVDVERMSCLGYLRGLELEKARRMVWGRKVGRPPTPPTASGQLTVFRCAPSALRPRHALRASASARSGTRRSRGPTGSRVRARPPA